MYINLYFLTEQHTDDPEVRMVLDIYPDNLFIKIRVPYFAFVCKPNIVFVCVNNFVFV